MAGKSASTSSPRINNLAVQTSSLGLPLTRGWGTGRAKCNLIWFGGFRSIPQTEKSGGKGGGVKNTTYSYTASVIMSIGHGPITGIRSVYRDKDVFVDGGTTALAQAGLSVALGTIGQAPWSYLTSAYPSEALAYSGTAYVYAQDYSITDSASLQNHSFEIVFGSRIAGLDDADPSLIVVDALDETPGWPAGIVGDLSVYRDYCLANNLVLSPVVEQQQTTSDFLSELMRATNSEIFWSEGLVKIVPYGDETATENGHTYTPDLTPIYDLTEDDFQPFGGDNGPPVMQEIVDPSDIYNIIQIEHLDRSNQYNTAIETAQDLDSIINDQPRKQDPISLHAICRSDVGRHVASLILNRGLNRRSRYKFRLPWSFILLEQMDYVTLTTTTDQLLLDRVLVQIKTIDEDDEGYLEFSAESVEVGTSSAPLYPSHNGDGYSVNTSVLPPSVATPVLINAPPSLTGGESEVWIAASSPSAHWGGCEVWVSADGAQYKRVGVITDPARFGFTTTSLPALPDPDTTSTLGVSIAVSGGQIETATQEDVDTGATLILVGDEVLGYRDATLTSAGTYDLEYLRRGLYGTTIASHVSGQRFIRLDEAVFRYAYGELGVGSTVHVKLPSFNEYGLALQSLADAADYTLSLDPRPTVVLDIVSLDTGGMGDVSLVWRPVAGALSYSVFIYSADGTSFRRTIETASASVIYSEADQIVDGDLPGYKIYVVANNTAGSSDPSSIVVGVGGTAAGGGGVQPVAVTGSFVEPASYNRLRAGCTTSPDTATTGYALYLGSASGFTPTGSPDRTSVTPSFLVSAGPGTYFVRIAAYNVSWDGTPVLLNFGSEESTTVEDYIDYCLDPSTRVLLSGGGTCSLGEVAVGTRLFTMSETGMVWGDYTVTASASTEAPERLRVRMDGQRELVGTPRHRVCVDGRGWTTLRDLREGDVLIGSAHAVVCAVEDAGAGSVVRLSVEGARTYISNGILSHNVKP